MKLELQISEYDGMLFYAKKACIIKEINKLTGNLCTHENLYIYLRNILKHKVFKIDLIVSSKIRDRIDNLCMKIVSAIHQSMGDLDVTLCFNGDEKSLNRFLISSDKYKEVVYHLNRVGEVPYEFDNCAISNCG